MSTEARGLPAARFSMGGPNGPRMGRILWELSVPATSTELWEALPKKEVDALRALVASIKGVEDDIPSALTKTFAAYDALLAIAPHWGGE
jgi:hypothetical protein